MSWYTKITSDLSNLPDYLTWCENNLQSASYEVKIRGNIQTSIASLPGTTEQYFSQLQEVEAVLNFMQLQLKKMKRTYFKKYLEAYNRELSSRDAEKYADGEEAVVDYEILINEVALIRNRYLGILKGLESKNFMLGHLVRLKTAGMEDFTIG